MLLSPSFFFGSTFVSLGVHSIHGSSAASQKIKPRRLNSIFYIGRTLLTRHNLYYLLFIEMKKATRRTAVDPLRLSAHLDEPWRTMHSLSRGFSGKLLADSGFPGVELQKPSKEEFQLHTQSVFSLRESSRAAFNADNTATGTLVPDYVYKGTWMAPRFDSDAKVKHKPVQLPRTQLQKDIGDDTLKCANQVPSNKGYIVRESQFHPYYGFSKTNIVLVDRPATIDNEEACRLVAPQDKRKNLEYTISNRRAQKLLRKASSDANRLIKSLKKNYPNGVVGFDSHDNKASLVYGGKAKKRAALKEKYFAELSRRGSFLKKLNNSKARRGYPLLAHSTSCGEFEKKHPFLQRKRRPTTAPKDGVVSVGRFWRTGVNKGRWQNLVNEDSGGRAYNIVNSTKRHFLPTCPEKRRMKERHPSTQHKAYCHPDEFY